MADRAEQQLLGYLLGALDDAEQERVEEQLAGDPALRQQLARWREALRPLEAARTPFEPPAGLAERTCCYLEGLSAGPAEAAAADRRDRVAPLGSENVSLAGAVSPPSRVSSWGWKDLATVAAILAAATLLLFPAIQNSRYNARLESCQDNLRLLGQALAQYSERYRDYFPPIPQQGRLAAAGMFAPVLASGGYLQSPRLLVCPASSLADERQFHIPSLEELSAIDDPVRLQAVRDRMGGSYGYSLGFVENGRYHSPRNLRRAFFALMSDAPSDQLPGHQSLNHAGHGQNVLLENLHVRFLITPELDGPQDRIFVNEDGEVAAGRHRDDAVIAGSGSPPIRYVNLGSFR